MGAKRRRGRSSNRSALEDCKRPRLGIAEEHLGRQVNHPTLRLYYKHISTLREYLLLQLPKTSRKRRRRIASLGQISKEKPTASRIPSVVDEAIEADDVEPPMDDGEEGSLVNFLDQTLVCSVDGYLARDDGSHAKDLEAFSQQISLTAGSSVGEGALSLSELIDFAIWLLFHRVYRHIHRPPHMLCHGYQRARGPQQVGDELCAVAGIPGIVSHYPNSNVSTLKSAIWNDALNLLGKESEQVMLDMIIQCGIFVKVESGKGNFYQLSGTPMTDMKVIEPTESITRSILPYAAEKGKTPPVATEAIVGCRTPASICFVRNRMFYARAALNTKGKVNFGLRHIHALNRYPDPKNKVHVHYLLQYVFPREFGLHNVFTSPVDPMETVQPFKDYTMREAEIARSKRVLSLKRPVCASTVGGLRIPKRLRRRAMALIQKLQVSHSKCSYNELLKHYCPLKHSKFVNVQSPDDKVRETTAVESVLQTSNHEHDSLCRASQPSSGEPKPSFFDLATPHANVSAFCCAAISKLVPNEFWGGREHGQGNKRNVMNSVDKFIKLRRHDPMSLHEVFQGLKVRAAGHAM